MIRTLSHPNLPKESSLSYWTSPKSEDNAIVVGYNYAQPWAGQTFPDGNLAYASFNWRLRYYGCPRRVPLVSPVWVQRKGDSTIVGGVRNTPMNCRKHHYPADFVIPVDGCADRP